MLNESLGFLLGFAFPTGMRRVEAIDPEPMLWPEPRIGAVTSDPHDLVLAIHSPQWNERVA